MNITNIFKPVSFSLEQSLEKIWGENCAQGPPPIAIPLRKDNFEKFQGFSGNSRAVSGFENENEGKIMFDGDLT